MRAYIPTLVAGLGKYVREKNEAKERQRQMKELQRQIKARRVLWEEWEKEDGPLPERKAQAMEELYTA